MSQRHKELIGAVALAILAAGCASTGAVPRPFPTTTSRPHAEPAADSAGTPGLASSLPVDSYALVGTALDLRGVRYRNGGSDPRGFDCSGFTQYVFAQHGVALPREVRDQFRMGKSIEPDDLAAGDMIFCTTTAPGPSHVAIAIGGDQFVHAPSTTGVVRVERLGSSYWAPRYLGARRLGK
jgi:cell wall-associated NlpC family hydrolase